MSQSYQLPNNCSNLFDNISEDQNQPIDMLFPILENNEVKVLLESWDLVFLHQTCISKLLIYLVVQKRILTLI